MREILFSGKRRDNGEWVISDSILRFEQIVDRKNCVKLWKNGNGWVEVDPETMGQFTGLYDKNGTRIFEGDILYTTENYSARGHYYKVVFEYGEFCGDSKRFSLTAGEFEDYEVIGNIHDNPELLEKI